MIRYFLNKYDCRHAFSNLNYVISDLKDRYIYLWNTTAIVGRESSVLSRYSRPFSIIDIIDNSGVAVSYSPSMLNRQLTRVYISRHMDKIKGRSVFLNRRNKSINDIRYSPLHPYDMFSGM